MATDLEKKAKEAFIDDYFELAYDLYSQAIEISPNSAELFADRAQASIKLQNFTGTCSLISIFQSMFWCKIVSYFVNFYVQRLLRMRTEQLSWSLQCLKPIGVKRGWLIFRFFVICNAVDI